MDHQSPSPWTLILLKYTPMILIPKLMASYSKTEKERRRFHCQAQFVHGPDATFTKWQNCVSFEKLEHIISLQEVSATATINCHRYPFIHTICVWITPGPEYSTPIHDSLTLKLPIQQALLPHEVSHSADAIRH